MRREPASTLRTGGTCVDDLVAHHWWLGPETRLEQSFPTFSLTIMAIQRNVQQQIDSVEAGIRAVAARYCQSATGFAWLSAVLTTHGIDPRSGLLVRISEVPEQEDRLVSGIWLASTRKFFEFSVLIGRETGRLEEIEHFLEVTSSMSVERNLPGAGQSFGFIALRVLAEGTFE